MRSHSFLLGLLVCVPLVAREDAPKPLTQPELQRELASYLSHKKFDAAQWGLKVMAFDSGAVLFETNAHKLLKPASTAKVFTGALALDLLGADAKIRTSILAKAKPN